MTVGRALYRLVVRLVGCVVCGVTLSGSTADGQTSVVSPKPPRMYTAEVGALFGGSWVSGKNAPNVTGGSGILLSLGLLQHISNRNDAGIVVRGSLQAIEISELGVTWDGGTTIEGQLLGTMRFLLPSKRSIRPQVDVAAGMTVISGAESVFPFSKSGRLAPMADLGVALGWFSGPPDDVVEVTPVPRVRRKELLIFVRYGVVRLDPAAEPGTVNEVIQSTAGFVGRVTAGLRFVR